VRAVATRHMANIAEFLNARPQLQRRLFFLARRFVPGETIESAINAVRTLNADKLSATLDFLGEDVFNEADAAHTTDTYIEMIDAIGSAGVDSNVSVKLSAIGQAIAEDLAVANLMRIIERARPSNMFVRLDMEGSKTVDSTYRIMERVRSEYEHVGPVVQAYLRRAAADVEGHIKAHVRIRLCKGAYGEPPDVAIQEMPLIRRNFAQLAQALLARGNYPGIATHDDFLIDAVRSFVEREHIPADRFEYQMLYGIRPEKQRAIVASGYRMRVYVPFGTHWAGYFYRRIAERKENLYFVARSLFSR
jgi:proline dehydrogenase